MIKKAISAILFVCIPFILLSQTDSQQVNHNYNRHEIVKGLIAPVILTSAGLFTYKEGGTLNKYDLQDFFHHQIGRTSTHVDDYLAFAPMVALYGLDASGIKAKNDFYNRSLMLIKSELLTMAIVNGLKYTVGELRPDSSNHLSFPSGHTAQAFMSATLLHKEYKDKSLWYSVAAYSTATAVGLLRILNNKHWTNDVLVGAATGILSVNVVYLTHRYKVFPAKNKGALIYPYSYGGYSGLGLIWDMKL